MDCPPAFTLSATLNLCKCKESIHCPRSYLFENDICSCGDKLHGAPGRETGLICPIPAVPLGTATIDPLCHFVFNSCLVSIIIYSLLLAYATCMFKCCVEKINDLSFFLFFLTRRWRCLWADSSWRTTRWRGSSGAVARATLRWAPTVAPPSTVRSIAISGKWAHFILTR
jgi:hypothetical protein